MAGTYRRKRRDTPVSAAGQGGKAGPQASSSCDRSSSRVGNLAFEKYKATRRHQCDRDPNLFCYICGKFDVAKCRKTIYDSTKSIYHECFGREIEENMWTPNIICNACSTMLKRWKNTKSNSSLKYTTPAIWKKPLSKEECYFCNTELNGFNLKNKFNIKYADVCRMKKPVKSNYFNSSFSNNEVMEVSDNNVGEGEASSEEEFYSSENETEESEEEYVAHKEEKVPILFTQNDLNNLIRRYTLPKDVSEDLVSELKSRNLVVPGTKSSIYREREKEFRKHFTKDKKTSLVYCTDIPALMNDLKPNIYKPNEWRLFIDSSKRSLKAVLLHNGNKYATVPIAHSISMGENYGDLGYILQKIKYSEHNWQVCGDLKIITKLLGQQSGFVKYPCFKCLWNSRDRENHYVKKQWPPRDCLQPGKPNVIEEPLIDPSKILLPPLHIKLGLMKQYVKALDKEGQCFQYIAQQFPKLTEAKIKEGIFNGPQIRKLFQDKNFVETMQKNERDAWLTFREVCENFLGNTRSEHYEDIVANLIENYRQLGCLMSLKLHFLDSHLDYFPDNLGDYSEEQGERFHQDVREMERRYQGRWDVNMLADYCWMLKRDEETNLRKRRRNPLHRSFVDKRVRYKRKK